MNGKLPTPKRGALPTPKDVRDKATPYIPDDGGPADDRQDDATRRSPAPPQLQDDKSDSKDSNTKRK